MSSRCYDQISRHGLTEVYRPVEDGDKPAAHVIFVHGLFGHPEKTWTGTRKGLKVLQQGATATPLRREHVPERGQRDAGKAGKEADSGVTDVFWPADLLPLVTPRSKVWTWGYDADIDGFWSSASQNTVAQHATNLLSDVADLLETRGCDLPIFFVVHSLGGLIVKAALNMSCGARGNRLKVVVPAVYGIIFLGTPHRGSKTASIGRIAYQITKAAARRPNEKLLQALEKNSDTLDQINDGFLQTLEEYQNIAVSSFREEKETRKFLIFSTIVVEADSARIGLAREELNSIPANHRHMAKLSCAEDIGFKRVSAQIRRWIKSLPTPSDEQDNQDYMDCVRSLDSSVTKVRLKNVATSHKETLQWVFDDKVVDFTSWLKNSDKNSSSIYWIQGKPGSGKSTLMKYAMTDSRLSDLLQTPEHLQYVISGFFFHDRGTTVQKSMSGMLQELLHSILRQASSLRQFVHPTYVALAEAQKTKLPSWDTESLQRAFEAILKQRQVKTRLCLFLDALDEHRGDNEYLAKLIKEFVALADGKIVKIKLCLASRPWDTFTASFSKCPGFKIHDHTYNDIRVYTLSEFRQSSPAGGEDLSGGDVRSAKLEGLAVQVTEKAHGVFIWVRIVVEEITRGLRARTPLFVLEEMLAKMPEELKDLYEHTLERIEPVHANEAYIMLQLALCALSPLPLVTFVNVASFSMWKRVPKAGEEALEDMMQRIVSRSGGLLEVIEVNPMDTVTPAHLSGDEQGNKIPSGVDGALVESLKEDLNAHVTHRVQFIHQTVKEYMRARKDNFGLKRVQTGGTGFHYILAATAAAAAANPMTTVFPYRCSWTIETRHDFFEYARLANQFKSRELQIELWNSLDSLPIEWAYYWIQDSSSDFYRMCSKELRVAKGNLELVALSAGLFEYLERRLSRQPNLNRALFQVLTCGAIIGPKVTSILTPRRDMLNFLAKHGFDINSSDYWLIKLEPFIFSHGLHMSDRYFTTSNLLALILSSKGLFDQDEAQRVSAIAYLLDHGADPNAEMFQWAEERRSIFYYALRQESAEVIRLMGQYGATLPRDMIVPVRTLWRMVSTPSPQLVVLIEIMRRNYPDVDFDQTWEDSQFDDEPGSAMDVFFCENDASVAAPIYGAITAMSTAMSKALAFSPMAMGRRRLIYTRPSDSSADYETHDG